MPRLLDEDGTAVAALCSVNIFQCPVDGPQTHSTHKEPDMDLVMGGLLIGASGMLALLLISAWTDPGSQQADPHPPHDGA